MSRGKSIDGLILEHIELRNRNAGGNRHFLDDIDQTLLCGFPAVHVHWRSAQHRRHRPTALRKLDRLHHTAENDRYHDPGRHHQKQLRIRERRPDDQRQDDLQRENDSENREKEVANQPLRLASRAGLFVEKVHLNGKGREDPAASQNPKNPACF